MARGKGTLDKVEGPEKETPAGWGPPEIGTLDMDGGWGAATGWVMTGVSGSVLTVVGTVTELTVVAETELAVVGAVTELTVVPETELTVVAMTELTVVAVTELSVAAVTELSVVDVAEVLNTGTGSGNSCWLTELRSKSGSPGSSMQSSPS